MAVLNFLKIAHYFYLFCLQVSWFFQLIVSAQPKPIITIFLFVPFSRSSRNVNRGHFDTQIKLMYTVHLQDIIFFSLSLFSITFQWCFACYADVKSSNYDLLRELSLPRIITCSTVTDTFRIWRLSNEWTRTLWEQRFIYIQFLFF